MIEYLLKEKINDSYIKNESLKLLLENRFTNLNISEEVLLEINDYILKNNEIYESNNFLKLILESFTSLNYGRFNKFIRNLITENPDTDRTYSHMMNDIKENLDTEYNLPFNYYKMTKEELNKECDNLLEDNKFLLLGKVRKYINENFKVSNYKSFVYENRDQAKSILRKYTLDETNKPYIRLRKLVEKNPGYLGIFTYFNIVEKIPFIRIKNIYKLIQEHKNIINQLENPITSYKHRILQKKKYTHTDGRTYATHFERLVDDLGNLLNKHNAKLFSDDYPGDIKNQLENDEDYVSLIKNLMSKPDVLEFYKKHWLRKVSKYKNKEDLIKSLRLLVMGNNTADNFRRQIDNDSNVKQVYDDGEIIMVRVLSHESLEKIASDANWCIIDSLSYWMDYVGSDNIQIVILNTTETGIMRKIGVTLYSYGGYNTAHKLNDAYFSKSDLEKFLKDNCLMSINDLYNISNRLGTNQYYDSGDISDDNYAWQ